jgi:hypothetical protein
VLFLFAKPNLFQPSIRINLVAQNWRARARKFPSCALVPIHLKEAPALCLVLFVTNPAVLRRKRGERTLKLFVGLRLERRAEFAICNWNERREHPDALLVSKRRAVEKLTAFGNQWRRWCGAIKYFHVINAAAMAFIANFVWSHHAHQLDLIDSFCTFVLPFRRMEIGDSKHQIDGF